MPSKDDLSLIIRRTCGHSVRSRQRIDSPLRVAVPSLCYSQWEAQLLPAKDESHMQISATAKSQAIDLLNRLPDDATLEQMVEALDFVSQINEGLADVDSGLTLSHAQVVREHLEWRKSAGR